MYTGCTAKIIGKYQKNINRKIPADGLHACFGGFIQQHRNLWSTCDVTSARTQLHLLTPGGDDKRLQMLFSSIEGGSSYTYSVTGLSQLVVLKVPQN